MELKVWFIAVLLLVSSVGSSLQEEQEDSKGELTDLTFLFIELFAIVLLIKICTLLVQGCLTRELCLYL